MSLVTGSSHCCPQFSVPADSSRYDMFILIWTVSDISAWLYIYIKLYFNHIHIYIGGNPEGNSWQEKKKKCYSMLEFLVVISWYTLCYLLHSCALIALMCYTINIICAIYGSYTALVPIMWWWNVCAYEQREMPQNRVFLRTTDFKLERTMPDSN